MLRIGIICGLVSLIAAPSNLRAQSPVAQSTPGPPPASTTNPSSTSSTPAGSATAPQPSTPPESLRLFGFIPNFRTAILPMPYQPLTTQAKFKIAAQDSFDRGAVGIALVIGGLEQAMNTNRAFGDGFQAYAEYASSAYANAVIRNYMTEAIYPTLLHQDPRYFRRGTGGKWPRIRYAIQQVFWTHNDAGFGQFNYSQVAGTATEIAISKAYIQSGRSVPRAAGLLGVELGVHAGTNILKEFWPAIRSKLHLRPHSEG